MPTISRATKLIPYFNQFSEFVIKNQRRMTPGNFSEELGYVQQDFINAGRRRLFCLEADQLAQNLVKSKNKDFPGIIYSALCKLTENFPAQLEYFAQKGYEVAKNNGDYVHMMARLNDLRKVYMNRPEKLYDYIQVLYKQEKCLKKLTNHYDSAVQTFQSVSRKPAPREEYRKMLAYIQTEIGKLTKKKHPHDAEKKLNNAKQIFQDNGDYKSVNYIDMLLFEIGMLG